MNRWVGRQARALWLVSAGALFAACDGTTPAHFTDGGPDVPAEAGRTYAWAFDEDAAGALPDGFIDVLGDWTVTDEGTLRQGGDFEDADFPRVVVGGTTFSDLTATVRCRPEAGSTDRACGMMFRLVDSDDYLLTRANALEDNVNLYRVVDGDRRQIGGAGRPVSSGEWHTLGVTADGPDLHVSWDGEDVIAATDATFDEGHVGLWTKADSVTSFDDLEVTAR